jgi:hypothetical protein
MAYITHHGWASLFMTLAFAKRQQKVLLFSLCQNSLLFLTNFQKPFEYPLIYEIHEMIGIFSFSSFCAV